MRAFWNDSSLMPPPIITTLHCNTGLRVKLKNIFNNMINTLIRQSPLHKESALLSRLLYKFDKKFRNDIGYRNFKKVSTALHKYLALNLLRDVRSFRSALPAPGEEPYLPSKQMLQYLLIRLLTFSKIMFRICVSCKSAAIFYMDRLRRGQSYWMSLMPYGLLSRVWSLSLVLMEHATSWYSNLYTYLDVLHLKGIDLLPSGFELPNDLETWLDLKNIDDYGKFNWSIQKNKFDSNILENDEADHILDYVKQINDNDDQNEDDNLSNRTTENEGNKRLVDESSHTETDELPQIIDKGQSISREYFKNFFNSKVDLDSKLSDKDNTHASSKVTNKASLQQFVEQEETFRNKGDQRSLTKHLSFMQWHILKVALEKLYMSLTNNRKIARKFQKIWQEKCLEYVQ